MVDPKAPSWGFPNRADPLGPIRFGGRGAEGLISTPARFADFYHEDDMFARL